MINKEKSRAQNDEFTITNLQWPQKNPRNTATRCWWKKKLVVPQPHVCPISAFTSAFCLTGKRHSTLIYQKRTAMPIAIVPSRWAPSCPRKL
jgi:hypothetical protein